MTVCSSRRLLFLCPVLDAGGAERHWGSLLPALRERGFGVRLVALHGGGRELEHLRRSEGVPVRELGSSGVRSLRLLPEVLGEGRGHPDAIVTFGYNAHAIGSLAARILRTPHVLNWHRQEGFPMSRVEQDAVRLAARLGAGVIAVTKAQVPDLKRLGFPTLIHGEPDDRDPEPSDNRASHATELLERDSPPLAAQTQPATWCGSQRKYKKCCQRAA